MKKKVALDEQNRRLLIYLSLLAAAIFIAIRNPDGLWLPIALAVGIAVDQLLAFRSKRRGEKTSQAEADRESKTSPPPPPPDLH